MFGKGGMGNLMKQAKEMQSKMAKAQEEVKLLEGQGSAAGDLVTICINGEREFTSISIKDEVLSQDKDMIEDLILVAANQAVADINKKIEDTMSAATGGMLGGSGFPGL